ncbi:MAG: AEC family transporter [Solirubrobacterales bacterium]
MPYAAAVLAVAAVILAGSAAGVLTARRRPDATAIADRMLWVSLWAILPVVTFFNFARFEPSAEVGAGLVFAYLGLATALALAWALARGPLRLEGHTRGAFMCAAFHANTGFLGLPFTAALLGRDALPEAITYDQLVSTPWLLVVAFSIGAVHRDERHSAEGSIRAFLSRNPALYALVAGLLAPDALAPGWAVDAANVLVVALAPLGFFALGVYATAGGTNAIRFPPSLTAPVTAAVIVKLTVPVAVVAGCAALIHDVPDAFLVQAAMPTGLNSLLLVAAYSLDRAIISGAIVYSTLAVLAWGLVAPAVS